MYDQNWRQSVKANPPRQRKIADNLYYLVKILISCQLDLTKLFVFGRTKLAQSPCFRLFEVHANNMPSFESEALTETGSGTAASERAADSIVSQIETMIVSGELADGAPLPAERDLMSRFGASRTVVREAVTILSIRGLIANRPRYRPLVRKPDFESAVDAIGGIARHLLAERGGVRNLFDTRVFIERGLVRDAAVGARKEDIKRLRDALNANYAAIPCPKDFYATDSAFHGVFYDISRNPVLPAIHFAFQSWLAGHWQRMPGSVERNELNFQRHQTIFKAILERDPDAAEEALKNHLHMAWEYVRPTFENGQL